MSLVKWIMIGSAGCVIGCGPNKSGLDGVGHKPTPGPHALAVKMPNQEWDVQSVLAIGQGGRLTIYFLRDAGIGCGSMAAVANAKSYVTLTLPEENQKYELTSSTEITENQIAATFVAAPNSALLFESLSLDLEINGNSLSAGLTGAAAGEDEIKGSFKTEICRF